MQPIQGILNVLNKTITRDNLKAAGRFLLKVVKAITLKRHHPPNDQPPPGNRVGNLRQERRASLLKAGSSIEKTPKFLPRRERAIAETCELLKHSDSTDPVHVTQFLHKTNMLLLAESQCRGNSYLTADDALKILKEWLTGAELPAEEGKAFLTAIESGQGIGKAFFAVSATTFLDKEGKETHDAISNEFTNEIKGWVALSYTLIIPILETLLTKEDEVIKTLDAFRDAPDPDPAYLNLAAEACRKEGG